MSKKWIILSIYIICCIIIGNITVLRGSTSDLEKKLSDATKIEITTPKKEQIGIIQDQDSIEQIIEIVTTADGKEENETCDAQTYNLEIYNEQEEKLETIYLWLEEERIIPESMQEGCLSYHFTLPKSIKDIILKNIKE